MKAKMNINHFLNPALLCILILFTSCSQGQEQQKLSKNKDDNQNHILIVYLSRTNNTKAVAEMIHQKVGGELVALELQKPYPADYQAHVDQVVKENETGYLPPLKTEIKNIQDYDMVFIGFPTWAMQLPPPMKSFLHQYDLSGKTVIPFNTNAGFGVGSGFNTIKELCPKSEILEGISIEGGYEKKGVYLAIKGKRAKEVEVKVDKWLEKTGIFD